MTPTSEARADRHAAHHFLRLMIVQTTAVLALIVLVFVLANQGRQELGQTIVRGCELAKLDRRANAAGWRSAEVARRTSATRNDIRAANRYRDIAEALEARSRIDCRTVYRP